MLVLHGDPGVGKSALMDYIASRVSGCRLVRAAGIESEMELAYAALHQLCAPLLDRLDDLPAPQRDALSTAFALSAGPTRRLLLGLAVLGLVSAAAENQPLVCLIDDLQWLDRASMEALAFVARRLGAETVALIMATRTADPEFTKLPKMEVSGLRNRDARALLDLVWTAPLDERVRDQIVAETRGNPLGASGTSSRSDRPRAGRRIWDAQCAKAFRAHRGKLSAPPCHLARADPPTATDRSRRADR